MRTTCTLVALPLALLLPACGHCPAPGAGGSSTTTTTAPQCGAMVPACPDGAFQHCEPGDTTVECCQMGQPIAACARPAGVLTHNCPAACLSGECAAPLDGGAGACCLFDADGGAGACDQP